MSSKYTKIIKYSLLVIDIIICLSGLIMLIAGSVIQGQINNQKLAQTINGYSTQSGSIICIIFGIFVLIFGLFGFYSALKDRYAFLVTYASVMSLVFLIQFITGVVGLSVKNSSSFDTYVEKVFANQLNSNSSQRDEGSFYQEYFRCCGWHGIIDYMVNGTEVNAPLSCCKDKKNCDVKKISDLFPDPCSTKLINASKQIIDVACGILVTFSIFNLFSIVLSGLLARRIRTDYQYT